MVYYEILLKFIIWQNSALPVSFFDSLGRCVLVTRTNGGLGLEQAWALRLLLL